MLFRATQSFPGQGSNISSSCQPTPQPQQLRIQALSSTYTTAHGSTRSLTHWARPGIEPTTSWFLVRFVSAAPQWELPQRLTFVLPSREGGGTFTNLRLAYRRIVGGQSFSISTSSQLPWLQTIFLSNSLFWGGIVCYPSVATPGQNHKSPDSPVLYGRSVSLVSGNTNRETTSWGQGAPIPWLSTKRKGLQFKSKLQTITSRMDKQWGPTVKKRELYALSWDRTWWKIIWEKECIYIYV